MSFLIKRQGCGFRDHMHYVLFMGTKIINTFVAEPPKGLGKIKLMGSRMHGEWCSNPRQVAMEMLNFFNNLFSSTSTCQPEVALESVQFIIIEEMNKELLSEFTEIEVQVAFKQMAPLKAPSPDGIPPFSMSIIWNWLVRISRHLFYLS